MTLPQVGRRAVLAGGLILPGIGLSGRLAAAEGWPPATPVTAAALVETAGGTVEGIARGNLREFKGIPYADAPTGPHRFGPPPPLTPWTGVRRAIGFGPPCPVPPALPVDRSTSVFAWLVPVGPAIDASEDCLRLNIWAPREPGAGRLPVMVWLHAGGFRSGAAHAYAAASGEVIAARGEAVVVSLNHRIGPLGHLDLSQAGGADLAESGNAGMLDIIAALGWVRDNIAAFGGDPGNVTLFGQSGGGYKISVLLAMPAARGLFHRAIIQSGARLRVHDRATTARQTQCVLTAARLLRGESAVAALRAMPADRFLALAAQAMASPEADAIATPSWAASGTWFEPVAGTAALPFQPGTAEALRAAAAIPIICGSNRNEISPSGDDPALEAIGWTEVADRLAPALGEATDTAIAAARAAFPEALPVAVLGTLLSRDFRLQALEFGRIAAAAGNAAVFNYDFAWQTPLFGGRPRAFHAAEVGFVFDTLALTGRLAGNGDAALAREMSARWAAFARSGDPALAWAAPWPAFGAQAPVTMVFDTRPRAGPPADLALAELLMTNRKQGGGIT